MQNMDLRPELLPPPVDAQRLHTISHEIERISNLIQNGDPADEAIRAFNQSTGHHYGLYDFAEYWAVRDLTAFALEAARPAHPRVPDITRHELMAIVSRILTADPETDYYLRLLDANSSHPAIQTLIFHPPPELQNASADQIVDVMLSHRPIAL